MCLNRLTQIEGETILKRALITGITGQDGRFLAQELNASGYEVFGTSRKSHSEFPPEVKQDLTSCKRIFLDSQEKINIRAILEEVQPDFLFNLSGMSSVSDSFLYEKDCRKANLEYLVNLLEAVTDLNLTDRIRIYQASSSEMFGMSQHTPQSELTDFHPISPYGKFKAEAHGICSEYREKRGFFISCGILFNHESEKRSTKFVSRKITKAVAEIKFGISESLTLGNLDSRRDWGFAGDYVKAMQKMLEIEFPTDFVVSTGKSHSVLDFVEAAFRAVGLEKEKENYLKSSPDLIRKNDHGNLVGNAQKAQENLNWKPTLSFEKIVSRMVEEDLKRLTQGTLN
jgi:GDPmannose 4,6-dehydratase